MAKSGKDKSDDQRSEKEAAERRDAILKTMLKTPPKPFTPKAKGKPGKR